MKSRLGYPNLGLGVGLRAKHFSYIIKNLPRVDFFEIITENFMDSAGKPGRYLEKIAKHYPLVMHGVSLSIGSTDPLNYDYLKKVRQLAVHTGAKWISDHLCWTGVAGLNTHDLLPIPFTKEALSHVANRVLEVQEFIGKPLVLENPSTYVAFADSELTEAEFISKLAKKTGCGLLLDINNVYVSSFNLGFDPVDYIQSLPLKQVVQFHIAGYEHNKTHIIDTHDHPVAKDVWKLYQFAYKLIGGASTLLEWDEKIPSFPSLYSEVLKAKEHML